MASKLSSIKYKLEQLLWIDIHNGPSKTRARQINNLYMEYRRLGGRSTLRKIRSTQFNK